VNITDYKYIITIAEEGSFTNAARELYIAQPSLSQRVRYIENEYGITIFERNSKGVFLTPEGEIFVKYAKEILLADEDLHNEIAALLNKENDMIRLGGATQLIGSQLFNTLIFLFHKKYPNIHFQILHESSRKHQDLLLTGKTDLALIYLPVTSPDLDYKIIYHDRYVLVPAAGSELEQMLSEREDPDEPVDPHLFDNLPLATSMPETNLYAFLMGFQTAYKTPINIQSHTSSYSMLQAIAAGGIASVVIPESYFHAKHLNTIYYDIDDPGANIQIAAVWRKKKRLSPTLKALVEIAETLTPYEARH